MMRRARLSGPLHRKWGQPVKSGAELLGFIGWSFDGWVCRSAAGEALGTLEGRKAAILLVATSWAAAVNAAELERVEAIAATWWVSKHYAPSHRRHTLAPRGSWWGPMPQAAAVDLAWLLQRPAQGVTVQAEQHAQGWTPDGLIVAAR